MFVYPIIFSHQSNWTHMNLNHLFVIRFRHEFLLIFQILAKYKTYDIEIWWIGPAFLTNIIFVRVCLSILLFFFYCLTIEYIFLCLFLFMLSLVFFMDEAKGRWNITSKNKRSTRTKCTKCIYKIKKKKGWKYSQDIISTKRVLFVPSIISFLK